MIWQERIEAEDEARAKWLDEQIAKAAEPAEDRLFCKFGHPKRERGGGKLYCPTCNAQREAERRSRSRRTA